MMTIVFRWLGALTIGFLLADYFLRAGPAFVPLAIITVLTSLWFAARARTSKSQVQGMGLACVSILIFEICNYSERSIVSILYILILSVFVIFRLYFQSNRAASPRSLDGSNSEA
jgi:hypothetical protein